MFWNNFRRAFLFLTTCVFARFFSYILAANKDVKSDKLSRQNVATKKKSAHSEIISLHYFMLLNNQWLGPTWRILASVGLGKVSEKNTD